MADARAKEVLGALADTVTRTKYLVDIARNLREPLGKGDIIEVPDITDLTVNADGSQAANPQSVTTNILALNANLEPFINAELPSRSQIQLMEGSWAPDVARNGTMRIKNSIDDALCQYLGETVGWTTGTANTYHFNENADALIDDDILSAKAALLAIDGVMVQNLALVVSSYGEGAIQNISGFVPNFQLAEQGMLGIPRLGSVFGVPVYATNAVRRNKSVTVTASAITSNVLTLTVGAGHGIVAGMEITTTGLTTNVTSATAVTSTTATTIVVPLTADDEADNGTGSCVDDTSWNLMVDLFDGVYVAQQKLPSARIVPFVNSTSDALQISAVWGRVGRVGRTVVIHTPGSTI